MPAKGIRKRLSILQAGDASLLQAQNQAGPRLGERCQRLGNGQVAQRGLREARRQRERREEVSPAWVAQLA